MILNIITIFFIVAGIFFLICGVIGIFRMKDTLCRLQAATNISTLGAMFIIVGASIYGATNFNYSLAIKGLIIIMFILITSPVASNFMGRASYKLKDKLCDETFLDEYNEEADFDE
ncbi:MAG: monovalent cation/H(+) antiporter subunit G [Clostridium sp.]|uniref:monovalent cation/H(+) antiporter subunit G n=1 Tax=Clostridium sp. TaxID=1506 RepID=UPI003F31B984